MLLTLLTGKEEGTAHINELLHSYTYSSSNCGGGTEVDPINVIFVGENAASIHVAFEAERDDHGGWKYSHGDTQYFKDHDGCEAMDFQRSSEGSLSLSDQWHMRFKQGVDGGIADQDPKWGLYVLAAAHHDQRVVCGFGFDHAVDGNLNNPPGGFNMAKNELVLQWVANANDTHLHVDTLDWDNTQAMLQCNGEIAWSDGYVMLVSMPIPFSSIPPSGGGGAFSKGLW